MAHAMPFPPLPPYAADVPVRVGGATSLTHFPPRPRGRLDTPSAQRRVGPPSTHPKRERETVWVSRASGPGAERTCGGAMQVRIRAVRVCVRENPHTLTRTRPAPHSRLGRRSARARSAPLALTSPALSLSLSDASGLALHRPDCHPAPTWRSEGFGGSVSAGFSACVRVCGLAPFYVQGAGPARGSRHVSTLQCHPWGSLATAAHHMGRPSLRGPRPPRASCNWPSALPGRLLRRALATWCDDYARTAAEPSGSRSAQPAPVRAAGVWSSRAPPSLPPAAARRSKRAARAETPRAPTTRSHLSSVTCLACSGSETAVHIRNVTAQASLRCVPGWATVRSPRSPACAQGSEASRT